MQHVIHETDVAAMSNPILTPEQVRTAVKALAELNVTVRDSLSLCAFRDGWQLISVENESTDAALSEIDPIVLATLPRPSVSGSKPFCHSASANRDIVGFPVQTTSEYPVFAIAQSVCGMDMLLETISRQSAELNRLREEHASEREHSDSFSDQVLRDFEERNWLIRMSDHLQICEVTRDIHEVAESLLPELKIIVRADAVAFVPEVSATEPGSPTCRIVCSNGSLSLTNDAASRIIQQFRNKAIARPFVKNWNLNDNEFDSIPGITTLMLVAVSRNNQVAGWLLAANRACDEQHQPRFAVDREDADFRDDGFGTAEAGLLRSAASVLATHQHNLKLFRANQNLTVSVIRSLAHAVDARDTYTRGHSERVARMARQLARRSGIGPQLCEQVFMTGLLHDIGKIGVPDRVLLKRSRLNVEEFDLIKRHPSTGHQILKHIAELSYTLEGVLHHHEAWNGEGYPEGRKNTEIPFFARVLAVVDAFDAMTSSRPYRDGMPFEMAETILRDGAGVQWDPALVDTFLQHSEDFRCICREFADDGHAVDFLEMITLSQIQDDVPVDSISTV